MIIAQSERLYFKQFCENDIDGFFRLNANIENIRFTGDVAFKDKYETAEFIRNYDHYKRYGYGRWSLYLKQTNEYVGFCGLRYCEQSEEVDIGYRIDQAFWGLGLASEAARTALDLGFSHFHLDNITSRARTDNPASIKVLSKNGFVQTGSETEDGYTWLTFNLNKIDFYLI